MLNGTFRPWGVLNWVLDRMPDCRWSLLGSISTGNRSLSVWKTIRSLRSLEFESMLEIHDQPSPYWGSIPEERLKERRKEFLDEGGHDHSIHECHIFDNAYELELLADTFIKRATENIIIDISTLPKRFFFPIIKRIIEKTDSNTILATYTRPETYDTKRPLAVDPEPWRELPGFMCPHPEPTDKKLIIGLGYETLGLPQLLKNGEFTNESVRLLFPFPASPAGYIRNWEFVRSLDSEAGPYRHEPYRVNGFNVTGIFDCIMSLTDNGKEYTIFAPYGTKPMSLAMCLYACYNTMNSAVYYTQPKSYNPNYSTGIRQLDGKPETYTYCIRIQGRDFYSQSNQGVVL